TGCTIITHLILQLIEEFELVTAFQLSLGSAMLGGVHADSLITLGLAFLAYLTTICRAENDLSLVKLPEWKEIS
ncbi:hypothetical protein ATANTOWER_026617, partial [Ataeniobius toweri]|nr:hypothetical protein [Ataeniobius toweri]